MDSSKATSTKTNGEQANLNDLQSESRFSIISDKYTLDQMNVFFLENKKVNCI